MATINELSLAGGGDGINDDNWLSILSFVTGIWSIEDECLIDWLIC